MTNPSTVIANKGWDVIVVGGGAAGLMASASAAARGRKTLLLEKNRKVGVKILMSGGTRCNITHNCEARGVVEAFGRNGRFLHSALAALSPKRVIEIVESQGVLTKIEDTGKIFPVSDRAIDVRDALVAFALQNGVTIVSGIAVDRLLRVSNDLELAMIKDLGPEGAGAAGPTAGQVRFWVQAGDKIYETESVIITTGGKSYPGCGTTGDGYLWAEEVGHSIVPTYPALTPILCNSTWVQDLKGITLERVNVRIVELAQSEVSGELLPNESNGSLNATPPSSPGKKNKSKILAQREGGLLFTHWGFSGPAILDVSREVASHPNRKQLKLICDFLPTGSHEALMEILMSQKNSEPKQQVIQLLPALFPRRFQEAILESAGVLATTRNADVSRKELMRLVEQIKSASFSVQGTLGFEKAEVTAGGVALSEVDSKTMQSKFVDGLFFAGEVLDLDGRIGGFNFQSAFSTGWLAGKWA